MTRISARIVGNTIIPDEPIDLPENTRLIVDLHPEIPVGATGEQLAALAGSIDAHAAKEMMDVIEQGCERVDAGDW